MELTSVESSMIQAVGYDEDNQLMEVVFKDGEVYLFGNVPLSEYIGLMGRTLKDVICTQESFIHMLTVRWEKSRTPPGLFRR